jgi:YegS/Rv2252/BmrU family lipid kinase
MAGSGASGKTHESVAGTAITVALVANEDSRSSNPALCAERLRSFGAEVRRFELDELDAAVARGADRVVVAGGDGSIAPVAAAAGAAGIPLAVIPAGTANDFASRMGVPEGLTAACRLAVRGTRLRSLELGWMSGRTDDGRVDRRPFVNVASVGLPAPAAERARSWKGRLGPLAYAAGAVSAGLSAQPLTCLVRCDGRELLAGEAWQVTVAASGAFGAGAVVPEADPADGALDVVAIEAGPRLGLVSLAYRLRSGSLTSHPRAYHARCDRAEVQVPDGTCFNVDGELLSEGEARFKADKASFRLVVG